MRQSFGAFTCRYFPSSRRRTLHQINITDAIKFLINFASDVFDNQLRASEYLSFVSDAFGAPLRYVRGNHDVGAAWAHTEPAILPEPMPDAKNRSPSFLA